MDEEDFYQEESFQDGQPTGQPREADRRRILADFRSLEGGEVSVSISQVPPMDPVLPPHLTDFIQSPRDSPGGMRPQRAGPTPQGTEPIPQRLVPTPSRASSGHQRPSRTLRVDPVQGSSQARLAFNNQPSESIRAASFSASPASSPRDFMERVRVVPPSFREHPAGEDAPWLS